MALAAHDVDDGLSSCPVALGCRRVGILPRIIESESPHGGFAPV
jgi:hypothetical protein